MDAVRQWTKNKALGYAMVVLLACGLTFVTGCTQNTNSNIQTACTVISTAAALITLGVLLTDPTSGSNLASLDLNQSLVNLSLSNASMYSTGGTGTVTVTDASTGSTLGQQSFGWVVSGDSIYAQNPTAVHNWLQQFSGYSSVDINVQLRPEVETSAYGSASATDKAEYDGTTYASATAGWYYSNPKQLCNPSPCRLSPSH